MVGVRSVAVVIVIVIGGVAWTACSSEGPEHRSTSTAPLPSEAGGADVFRTRCASCHGRDGTGNLGPSLIMIATRMTLDDELAIVRQGRGRMPAFRTALSDAALTGVVDYTRTQLAGSTTPPRHRAG
jgi:mono/diheme cytochrome c family protein